MERLGSIISQPITDSSILCKDKQKPSQGGPAASNRGATPSVAIEWFLLLTALGVMIGIVVVSPQGFTSDESWYLNQVGYVQRDGHGIRFLESYRGSAGPLFVWMHHSLLPITNLDLPWVRLVNTALLGGCALVVAGCTRIAGWPRGSALRAALATLAFAPLWKCAGLAYTEMASLFCASLAVALLGFSARPTMSGGCDRGGRKQNPPYLVVFGALGAGLAMSLAIMGRQPLLAMPILLMLVGGIAGRRYLPWTLSALIAIPLPAIAFVIWQGLQPPTYTNNPLEWRQGVHFVTLSAAYAGGIALLLRPDWLLGWNKGIGLKVAGVWMAAGSLSIIYLAVLGPPPLATRLATVFGSSTPLATATGLALVVLGTITLGRLACSSWQAVRDPLTFFCLLMAGAVICSHLIIGPVFSNRYMAIAAPFLILAWGPDLRTGWWWPVGYIVAITWGAASLWGHLDGNQGRPFHDGGAEHFYPHLWRDVPEVYSEHYWNQFDYGNSEFLKNPLVGDPVLEPWRPEPLPENPSE